MLLYENNFCSLTLAGPVIAETSNCNPSHHLNHITPPPPPLLIVLPTIQYLWCRTLIFLHNFGFSVFVPEPQFVLCANVAEVSRFRVHGSRLTVQGSLKCSLQSLIYWQSKIEQIIYTQTCMYELL